MKAFKTLAIAGIFLAPTNSTAEEFGKFSNRGKGEFVHQQGAKRDLFWLSDKLIYKDVKLGEWEVPSGEVIDGTSAPDWIWWWTGGPIGQLHTPAAIVHDYYFCTQSRDYDLTNEVFYRGMISNGVGETKAWIMRKSVEIGGPDRWVVEPNKQVPAPCRTWTADGRVIHNNYQYLTEKGRRIFASKMIALARTYKATGGELMDVVDGKPIPARGEIAQQHVAALHEAVKQKFDFPIEKLGLFSVPEPDEVKDVDRTRPWKPGQISAIDIYLKENSIAYVEMPDDLVPKLIENPHDNVLTEIPDDTPK